MKKLIAGAVCVALGVVLMASSFSAPSAEQDEPMMQEAETAGLQTALKLSDGVGLMLDYARETEPRLYDVPLERELQKHIIAVCEEHGIDPRVVIAMAYRESSYRAQLIGDGGDSYGLLQVQPKWHRARMARLGVTDLLDPYQNVTVAVDYLAEKLEAYGEIGAALTAYNQGFYKGTITQYARNVLATAEQIRREERQ